MSGQFGQTRTVSISVGANTRTYCSVTNALQFRQSGIVESVDSRNFILSDIFRNLPFISFRSGSPPVECIHFFVQICKRNNYDRGRSWENYEKASKPRQDYRQVRPLWSNGSRLGQRLTGDRCYGVSQLWVGRCLAVAVHRVATALVQCRGTRSDSGSSVHHAHLSRTMDNVQSNAYTVRNKK